MIAFANPKPSHSPDRTLYGAIGSLNFVILATAIFSAIINILMLTGSFYMLEVYDRVIPSRSIPTLVMLSLLALGLYISQGILEVIRSRIFIRIGSHIEDKLSSNIFNFITQKAVKNSNKNSALQPMRDMAAIKTFLSSGGPSAMFDLPWVPFYIVVMFLFHWALGLVSVLGVLILAALTLFTELKTRKPSRDLSRHVGAKSEIALAAYRNADLILAMGITSKLTEKFRSAGRLTSSAHTEMSDLTGSLSSISRILRITMQSGVLGVGALLVILNESTAGIIIAGSILFGRALAPIDQAIANWKSFVAARQGWKRLSQSIEANPDADKKIDLPEPHQYLRVQQLGIQEPDGQRIIIKDVGFQLKAGENLCIIGSSGAGKSTLARALVNSWKPSLGRIDLDGASLDQWTNESLGRYIGYLPQDVELIDGTIAENISRHHENPPSSLVIEAAKAADVHGLITNLQDGYQTRVGEVRGILSAGQRQRIGLARALYGNPFLVVLDEPNSNLDWEGELALIKAIHGVRERKGILIAISHRSNILSSFDYVLILKAGKAVAFGPREAIVTKYFRNTQLGDDPQEGKSVSEIV